jgi:hypothetical protein
MRSPGGKTIIPIKVFLIRPLMPLWARRHVHQIKANIDAKKEGLYHAELASFLDKNQYSQRTR